MELDSPRCLRCSEVIRDAELVVYQHGDWLHVGCLQRQPASVPVGASRSSARRSRDRQATRELLGQVGEALSKEACVVCGLPVGRVELLITDEGLAHRACATLPAS